jgi:SPP1 family predicted phage head-tail adaptor
MLPAGILRETYEIQAPTDVRNALGERVPTWSTIATVRGSYEAVSYNEAIRRNQVGGNVSATVRMRYFPGLAGNMRLRWTSRGGRILSISGIVEHNNREEHELQVEEAQV